ncbi:hypothetical protein MXB_2675, partial [Myxobolus squamalis]
IRIFDSADFQKTIRVAVIGRPNSGKSSFINLLTGHHILPVSQIPHTTFNPLSAIKTFGDTQFIFYDTPGIMSPKYSPKSFKISEKIESTRETLNKCDMTITVVDSYISQKYSWISPEIQSILID